MTAMTSQAAYWALRKDEDDDSTLAGSRVIGSDRSMEYSTSRDGASTVVSVDGVSLASSLFQGDRYFQEEAVLPPEWSNETRGRQFAKTLIDKSSNAKGKKTGLLQRAVRAFRRRKTRSLMVVENNDKVVVQYTTSEDDEFSDGEITFDQASSDPWQDGTAWEGETTKITLPIPKRERPPRDLDEISDCTSDATTHTGEVEVFLPSDASESPSGEEDDDTLTEMLRGESPISMPRRHRDAFDQFFPDGLFLRNSAEDIVEKLKLGDAGRYALKRLDEASEAATKAFDPSDTSANPDEIPTLVTIAGYAVPDYKTYVRQAVNSFRRNVLQMSDDLYALLERRMAAKNYVISNMRLLPFAVELYALERLMMAQSNAEAASI